MKKRVLISTVLVISALFTCSAFAAGTTPIGVIDFEKVFKESSAGKVMQKELKAKHGQLQAKLQAEGKKVDEMSSALESDALVLSAEKKLERQRALRDRSDDLKKMKADSNQDMQLLQNRRMNQIQKDVIGIINKMGKEKGYPLIIEKKIGGVIYASDQVDITDEVIKAYNAIYAAKK